MADKETIWAKWMAGELSPEELSSLEQHPEFEEHRRIIQGMERFQKPAFDKEALRAKIIQHRGAKVHPKPKSPKVVSLKWWGYVGAAAAVIALLFGVLFVEVEYSTAPGETLVVELPDGSQVQLNSNSSLSRKRFLWNSSKEVALEGEAYFKIQKGDGFTVQANSGIVGVLGTEFNVKDRGTAMEVACFEGKVRFKSRDGQHESYLTKGMRVRLEGDQFEEGTFSKDSPDWMQGRSVFNSISLGEVLVEMEAQFGIRFEVNGADISQRFTGSFTHENVDIALQTVLVPMGIPYQLDPDKKVVILGQ
ncbi:FecR domain-containing protein [Flagellimonas sp.]|uniref:FecR domain-containing protein n=1 Tax=Flagellimonas sp. TaxID=2058762 RepID=UPI003B51E094